MQRLEVGNAASKGFALAHVDNRLVERGLAAADRTGADVEPTAVEASHRNSEADTLRTDTIRGGNADALHDHLTGRLCPPSHLFLYCSETQARRAIVDQKGGDPGWAALAGARHDEIDIADASARNELLDAVEHVIGAITPRARRQRSGVGARARLGQAVARDQFHVGEAGR